MIRHIKRYLAIRSYVRRLSQDLARRFGKRAFYTVDHVTQAVQRGKFSKTFIAYAHAAYCAPEDFEAFYRPLKVNCNYYGLRRTIARRYLSGCMDFDASVIIAKYRHVNYSRGDFYESDLGSDYPGP